MALHPLLISFTIPSLMIIDHGLSSFLVLFLDDSKVRPRYDQGTTKVRPRYDQGTTKVRPRYDQGIPDARVVWTLGLQRSSEGHFMSLHPIQIDLIYSFRMVGHNGLSSCRVLLLLMIPGTLFRVFKVLKCSFSFLLSRANHGPVIDTKDLLDMPIRAPRSGSVLELKVAKSSLSSCHLDRIPVFIRKCRFSFLVQQVTLKLYIGFTYPECGRLDLFRAGWIFEGSKLGHA
jgi:hypothetical protein